MGSTSGTAILQIGWNFAPTRVEISNPGFSKKNRGYNSKKNKPVRAASWPIFVLRTSTAPSTSHSRPKVVKKVLQLKCGLPSPGSVFCCQEQKAGCFDEVNWTRERGGAAFMSCGSKLRKAFRHSEAVVMVCSLGHATCPSAAK